jgi:predicted transcriptional regulator
MVHPELSPLTKQQRDIMEIVWSRGEVSVNDVRDELKRGGRGLARNTVQTMLVRLEEKGWLTHREEGRAFLFSARVPQTVSLGAKVSQMIDQFFTGSPEEMVTALIEYRGLTPAEANRIREMIDLAESKTASRKRKGKK